MLKAEDFKSVVGYGSIEPDEKHTSTDQSELLVESKEGDPLKGEFEFGDREGGLEMGKEGYREVAGEEREEGWEEEAPAEEGWRWAPQWCTKKRVVTIAFWSVMAVFLVLCVTRVIVVEERRHGSLLSKRPE
ncbi:hypothetical protein B484DRAFT_420747, partial [Ochromonadaceae sp. CCMP2298]